MVPGAQAQREIAENKSTKIKKITKKNKKYFNVLPPFFATSRPSELEFESLAKFGVYSVG